MHAVGLHSALAIRRERKRRQAQQRAKERRYSQQSTESGLTSPHCSTGSLERRRHRVSRHTDNEVVSSVGMLHVGVVFLVLGLFLIMSGWLPDDVTSWSAIGSAGWWNELVCVGIFSLGLGIFLVVLHKYLTKNEEDALEEYVQRQLTRSRSGHRLERDVETGGMVTKQSRLARAGGNVAGVHVASPTSPPASAHSLVHPMSPSPYVYPPANEFVENRGHGFVNALANGDALRDPPLEQIAEEECSVASESVARLDHFNRETYFNSAAPSLSPETPSDTKELLGNGRYLIMSRM